MKNNHKPFHWLTAFLLNFNLGLLPDDPNAGGGGSEPPAPAPAAPAPAAPAEEPSSLLKTLMGLDSDDSDEEDGDKGDEAGGFVSLQQAIAAPTDEEKAADAKAEADRKAESDRVAAEAAQKAEADRKAAELQQQQQPHEPITVKKKKAVKTAEEIAAETAQQATAQWENSLLEEERDQLELARFAERQNPEKFKGYAANMEKFLKEHAAKTEAKDFDPESDEYKEWLAKAKPVFSDFDVRKLERARGAELAREESMKASNEILDKTFRAIETPAIKAAANTYFHKATTEVMPEAVAKVFKASAEDARKEFPLEITIVENVLSRHTDDIEEMFGLMRINPETRHTLKTFNSENAQHQRILNMVTTIDRDFKANGGNERIKGGRQFLPRDELARLPEKTRANYWTFTAAEIAERSTKIVKREIDNQITAELDRLKSLGFERKQKPAEKPKETPAPPAPAPRPTLNSGSNSAPQLSAGDALMRQHFGLSQ